MADKIIKVEIELELKEANINGQEIEFFEVNGSHNGFDLTFKIADKTTKKYLLKQVQELSNGIKPKNQVSK